MSLKGIIFSLLLLISTLFQVSDVCADDSSVGVSSVENLKQPNIVWILLDACRAQNLGCYGYGRATSPCIDQLAASGTVFENNFSQASRTFASVPSFMTGTYFPVYCFSRRFSFSIFDLTPPEGEVMFGDTASANGYASAMFTNMPLFTAKDRLARSFDESFFWKQGKVVLLQRWSVMNGALHGWLEAPKNAPFFLYIHASDTHFPHEMVAPYKKWMPADYNEDTLLAAGYGQNYRRKDGAPFKAEDRDYLLGLYDGAILDADEQIRLLVEKLQQLGLFDNTIFIISADHGQLLGEDGYTVAHLGGSDEVLHVPLILSGPGIPQGKRVKALTENVDIVPTLVDLLSLSSSARYDGRSLVPLLQGTMPADWRAAIFSVPDRDYYEDPRNFAVANTMLKHELDASGKVTEIYTMPDSAENRNNVLHQFSDTIAATENKVQTNYLPMLLALQSLPKNHVILDAAWLAKQATPQDAVVNTYARGFQGATTAFESDNKWVYTDGFLWARNDREQVPSLFFKFDVPTGDYRAQVSLLNSLAHDGTPASSLNIQFSGDATPRRVILSSLPDDAQATEIRIPIGSVEVQGDVLEFSIHPGDERYWTSIKRLELEKIEPGNETGPLENDTEQDQTPHDAKEYHELIRGLGYF